MPSQAVWLSAAVTEIECCLLNLDMWSSCYRMFGNMIYLPSCYSYVCWGRGLCFIKTTYLYLKVMPKMISTTFHFYSLVTWLIAQEYFIAFVGWFCVCNVPLTLCGKVVQYWNKAALDPIWNMFLHGQLLIVIWTRWCGCYQNVILSCKLGKVSLLFLK